VLIIRQTDLYEGAVRRQAETLARAGYRVDVLCMRHPGCPRTSVISGVRVTRLPVDLKRASAVSYLAGYGAFLAAAGLTVTARTLRRRYQVVQVNSMPDCLVFCAAPAKLAGAKVLAYMNEPTPELCETITGSRRAGRLAVLLEQAALRFADAAITVTPKLRGRYAARGADAAKIAVVLNGADRPSLISGWRPTTALRSNRFTVICHGTIEERYGQDTIVHAAALARERIPNLAVVFTGRGSDLPRVLDLARRLGVDDIVRYEGRVDAGRLNDLLHASSVGIVAQKSSSYSNLVTTNKMVDYWIHGLPVIASRLAALAALCDDDTLEYYAPDSARSLADAILRLHRDPARRTELARNGLSAAERFGWSSQHKVYLRVYAALLAEKGTVSGGTRSPSGAGDDNTPA